MVNLSDSFQCNLFLTRLVHCERHVNSMSDWEQEFVTGMRERFDSREEAIDLGCTAWNPTTNQMNTLATLQAEYK